METWKSFFSALPWQDLVPDQKHTTVTSGYGTFGDGKVLFDSSSLTAKMMPRVSQSDYSTAARTQDGSYVVLYMPTPRTVTVNMTDLRGPVSAKWFDPTNGKYQEIQGSPLPNIGSRQFTPPGMNHAREGDWVLLLKAGEPITK